jgi:hypothetical protein
MQAKRPLTKVSTGVQELEGAIQLHMRATGTRKCQPGFFGQTLSTGGQPG